MATVPHYCQNCGGFFTFELSRAVCDCPACGMTHARPQNATSGSYSKLSFAHQERAAGRFREAEAAYTAVLGAEPDNHEARWGRMLCRYGVEFVVDPETQEEKATIHHAQPVRTPVFEDVDYVAARESAPEEVRTKYEDKAGYIDRVRRILITPGQAAQPVDVFLCYKGSGEDGQTPRAEQGYAQKLYYALRDEGYRVFFAHETLQRDAAGEEYEAVIHRALYSARVMLLICADAAALQTPWVRSEWRRFMRRIDEGGDCHIIPLFYDGFDPSGLPDEFSLRGVQGLKMYGSDALTAYRNLLTNLGRYVQPQKVQDAADGEVARRLLEIEYALDNGEWDEATRQAEVLRRVHPHCAKAYLYKLLAKMHLAEPDVLAGCETAFEDDADWKWALRLASPAEKTAWTGFLAASQKLRRQKEEERRRAEEERCAWEAREAEERCRAEEERRLAWETLEAEECRRAEEERRRAEEERRAREAREAEERRRAEEARRAREAREAAELRRAEEERRRAEEERRAREAREAAERRRAEEERRREEQARRAHEFAERQRQIKAQEEVIWRLLEAGKWDEAAMAADNIPWQVSGDYVEYGDKTLLKLLAKHHLPSIAALAKSDKACSDPLFRKAVRTVLDAERREQLQQIEQEARQRREKKEARTEFLGKLFPALGAVLLMLAAALLPLVLPDHAGRITLGVELVALVLLCVYDVLAWRKALKDRREVFRNHIIGDAVCGVLVIALLCVSLFVQLPAWATLAMAFAGALMMAIVRARNTDDYAVVKSRNRYYYYKEEYERIFWYAHACFAGLPLLWLVLHLAGRLLLSIFTPTWLVVVVNVVTYSFGGLALLGALSRLWDKDPESTGKGVQTMVRTTLTIFICTVLMVASTYGVLQLEHCLPDWTAEILLAGALLTLLLVSVARFYASSGEGTGLIAVAVLLIVGALCATLIWHASQLVCLIFAGLVLLLALCFSGRMIPLTVWSMLHTAVSVLSLYVQAPWVAVAATVVNVWLAGLVTVINVFIFNVTVFDP